MTKSKILQYHRLCDILVEVSHQANKYDLSIGKVLLMIGNIVSKIFSYIEYCNEKSHLLHKSFDNLIEFMVGNNCKYDSHELIDKLKVDNDKINEQFSDTLNEFANLDKYISEFKQCGITTNFYEYSEPIDWQNELKKLMEENNIDNNNDFMIDIEIEPLNYSSLSPPLPPLPFDENNDEIDRSLSPPLPRLPLHENNNEIGNNNNEDNDSNYENNNEIGYIGDEVEEQTDSDIA